MNPCGYRFRKTTKSQFSDLEYFRYASGEEPDSKGGTDPATPNADPEGSVGRVTSRPGAATRRARGALEERGSVRAPYLQRLGFTGGPKNLATMESYKLATLSCTKSWYRRDKGTYGTFPVPRPRSAVIRQASDHPSLRFRVSVP